MDLKERKRINNTRSLPGYNAGLQPAEIYGMQPASISALVPQEKFNLSIDPSKLNIPTQTTPAKTPSLLPTKLSGITNAATSTIGFASSVKEAFNYDKSVNDLHTIAGQSQMSTGGHEYQVQKAVDADKEMEEVKAQNKANTLGLMGQGASTGAAVGSLLGPVGGAIGGAIGGVVGLIGGLFGSSRRKRKAREAIERQHKEASLTNEFNRDIATTARLSDAYTEENGFDATQYLSSGFANGKQPVYSPFGKTNAKADSRVSKGEVAIDIRTGSRYRIPTGPNDTALFAGGKNPYTAIITNKYGLSDIAMKDPETAIALQGMLKDEGMLKKNKQGYKCGKMPKYRVGTQPKNDLPPVIPEIDYDFYDEEPPLMSEEELAAQALKNKIKRGPVVTGSKNKSKLGAKLPIDTVSPKIVPAAFDLPVNNLNINSFKGHRIPFTPHKFSAPEPGNLKSEVIDKYNQDALSKVFPDNYFPEPLGAGRMPSYNATVKKEYDPLKTRVNPETVRFPFSLALIQDQWYGAPWTGFEPTLRDLMQPIDKSVQDSYNDPNYDAGPVTKTPRPATQPLSSTLPDSKVIEPQDMMDPNRDLLGIAPAKTATTPAGKGKKSPANNKEKAALGWLPNFISSSATALAGLGQYLGAKGQNIYKPNTYVRNPYAGRAYNILAGMRPNELPIINNMLGAQGRAYYGLDSSGGLSAAQKYLGRIATARNTQSNIYNALAGLQNQYNQYRTQYANALLTGGAQEAANMMNTMKADNDVYMRSHAARQAGMQQGLQNMLAGIQQGVANDEKRRMFNKTYNLYATA